jgi:CHAT domain-containing protein
MIFFLASKRLADLLQEQHSDPWLQDFLNALKPGDTAGLLALQQAIQLNQKQHASDARDRAVEAALFFRKSHNPAGEIRARYEEIYADQRSLNGQLCLDDAATLEPRVRATSYHELFSRLLVDKAICEKRAGRPGEIDKSLDEAQQVAEKFKFQVITLRVLGIASGLKKEAGACPAAWAKTSQGLEVYWQGGYPAERLFQFYQPLSECSENQQLWHTADALRTRAIQIRESIDRQGAQNSIMLGVLYLDSANIQIALRREGPAAKALATAVSIFQKDGEQPTTRKFRADILIRLAELQFENGNPGAAFHTLEPVLDFSSSSGDTTISMRGNRVLGDINRAKSNLAASAEAYQKGIILSERSLSTLASSRERLDWIVTVDKLYRGLTEVWLKNKRSADAWKLWEWYKSRSVQISNGHQDRETPGLTWAEMERKILQTPVPDEPMPRLSFAVFDDGVQTWVVRHNKITARWKEIHQAKVEQKTNVLFERASNPASELSDVWAAGEDLYSILWEPVAGDLPGSGPVIVELDAPIQHLLIEAIRTRKQYLFEKYEFIYSPGILMDSGLRAPRKIDSRSPTFLLNASTSSGESPIPSQLREVRTVSRQLANVDIGDGASITLKQIRSNLQKNEIFFFAGHGLRNGEDLSLVVNPSLMVKASDLMPENMSRLQLAILAACSTGTSDENGLMDTHSLDNSFLAAGVPRVISSRWDVDSDSTADLMEGIVTKLGQRAPVAQAMYSVQQDILKKEQHPYYWAGFYFAGRAD